MNVIRPTGNVQYDNTGRVVLVTGGGRGIGRAVVDAFAESGATVVCFDIRSDSATDLPAGVKFIEGDVAQDADCRRAVERTVAECGGLDVLVNNAAIQPPASYRPAHQLPPELWQRMVEINMTGYFHMARHALAVMLKQQCGVIVNVASGQGHRTARSVAAYGSTKAANLMQTRQWGIEYAREGIRVVSVSPGAIDTPLVRASLADQGGEAALANRHPLGRIGRVEEVAAAVLWLASSDASFITATDLAVDGGLDAFGAFADPYPSDDPSAGGAL